MKMYCICYFLNCCYKISLQKQLKQKRRYSESFKGTVHLEEEGMVAGMKQFFTQWSHS